MVWDYFIRTENGGFCKLCGQTVKSGGNTTNLKNHINRKHGDISITKSNNVQNKRKQEEQHDHRKRKDYVNDDQDDPDIPDKDDPAYSNDSIDIDTINSNDSDKDKDKDIISIPSPSPSCSSSSSKSLNVKKLKNESIGTKTVKLFQPRIDKALLNVKAFEKREV
ncbi:protein PF14_0175-like [Temnothorax curvispinosus]|uniref:Protein PF14_0175-like n=1 Tax=Temnothorax curvispinosus TaxID=300111 RepID=A0A6J1Q560_9HYME|nr:protein PF14_0175-like [Temnothorax curvispinosus]